jgi:hypothetical protein
MSAISTDDVIKQSKGAYNQWCKQWREHAKINSKHPMKSFLELKYSGIGRAVLAVANGYSLEENIETIKEHQHKVDIICVDKTLKHLLDHGITPKFVLVCDANVSYERYMAPVKDQLQDTTLIMNVCANPLWADNGNWKDKFFFVNKDVLGSEKEFQALSGCPNVTAAATNVSNSQVVILTQCDNENHQNFFGYDKILLIGYDYCWDQDSYYAFDRTGDGKTNYMRGCHVYNHRNEHCYTSTNLLFSAKWLDKYITSFRLPVIQCSERSLLAGYKICPNLAEQMNYCHKPEHSTRVIHLLDYKKQLLAMVTQADGEIAKIARDHQLALIRTI